MFDDIIRLLEQAAPTVATMLGGPLAGAAVSALESALGLAPGTAASNPGALAAAVQGMTPEAQAKLAEIDANLKATLAKTAADSATAQLNAAVATLQSVNATMQSEAKAEHWPTYTWRPMIGFAVAFNTAAASLLVVAVYVWGMVNAAAAAAALAGLPGVLGALAAISATALPVLGIASYFRGKMQADPNVATDMRG